MAAVNLSKQTVNLSKNQVINLSKSSEGLKDVLIGLGWSEAQAETQVIKTTKSGFLARLFGITEETTVTTRKSGYDYDLDAWVAFLENGKLKDFGSVCYYGKKDMGSTNGNFVHHHGDDLTGGGDVNADNEQIDIHLNAIPSKYDSAIVGVTIYQGKGRHQSFGEIRNFFVRVVDKRDGFEICRYADQVASEYKDAITFIVGKIYKENGEWQFRAEGYGTRDGSIADAAANYN